MTFLELCLSRLNSLKKNKEQGNSPLIKQLTCFPDKMESLSSKYHGPCNTGCLLREAA